MPSCSHGDPAIEEKKKRWFPTEKLDCECIACRAKKVIIFISSSIFYGRFNYIVGTVWSLRYDIFSIQEWWFLCREWVGLAARCCWRLWCLQITNEEKGGKWQLLPVRSRQPDYLVKAYQSHLLIISHQFKLFYFATSAQILVYFCTFLCNYFYRYSLIKHRPTRFFFSQQEIHRHKTINHDFFVSGVDYTHTQARIWKIPPYNMCSKELINEYEWRATLATLTN